MNKLIKHNAITAAVKIALLTTVAFSVPTLHAAEDEEVKKENKIVVTGSRLRRESFETPAPVTVVSSVQIERSGVSTLGDILANLPQLNSTFTSQNSGD